MSNKRVKPFYLGASGVVASQASTPQNVSVHSMVLTESAGTTNETFTFYVPVPTGDGSTVPVAGTGGNVVMVIEVPKGTSLPVPGLGDGEGLYFENGLYVQMAGGTGKATLAIS